MVALYSQGESISDLARKYQVSRQTIYNQLKRAHRFSEDPDVKMRMNFMNHNDLCTTIDIDFRHEKITIHNYTEQILLRAFGVIENPDWKDFEYFLEDRCFPRTRDHAKEILREISLLPVKLKRKLSGSLLACSSQSDNLQHFVNSLIWQSQNDCPNFQIFIGS